MLAHRVGAIGAIVAVVVLTLELAGALAWRHHADGHHERWAPVVRSSVSEPKIERVYRDVKPAREVVPTGDECIANPLAKGCS